MFICYSQNGDCHDMDVTYTIDKPFDNHNIQNSGGKRLFFFKVDIAFIYNAIQIFVFCT